MLEQAHIMLEQAHIPLKQTHHTLEQELYSITHDFDYNKNDGCDDDDDDDDDCQIPGRWSRFWWALPTCLTGRQARKTTQVADSLFFFISFFIFISFSYFLSFSKYLLLNRLT